VIYGFGLSQAAGIYPYFGSLAIAPSGELFGTTQGNESVSGTFGTVFGLQPPAAAGDAWTFDLLFTFENTATSGYNPINSVVLGAGGVLYGTTQYGGAGGDATGGVVFALLPPSTEGGSWSEVILHAFSGPDGQNPGPLTKGNGVLYGAAGGGALGGGTIYSVIP
jgi:hypothetical protein